MTVVRLVGMQFHARVGILDHERAIPQPIEVDLEVDGAPPDAILDYRTLYAAAASVLAADPIDYLEEVADRIIAAARADVPAGRIRCAVRKPHVALGGPLRYAEIVIERDA